MLDLVDTLCQLIRIPSVNPMGRDVSGPEFLETRLTEYLEGLFQRLDLPYERQQVAPQRDNIVARLDGSRADGPILLLEAHQDTVPVDGMTIAPFTPHVHQQRVYGRGACDIKGGMACMLAALARLAEERPDRRPTVVLACSVNEEHGFSGATELAQWLTGGKCRLLTRSPDAAIVAEPTQLNVIVAHKGVVRWRCHSLGRAAHSSVPQQGDNAIYRMGRVLEALCRYATSVVPEMGRHPLLGVPTLSVGRIEGGISVNTVPDRCTIEIDRRILPGQEPKPVQAHVLEYLATQLDEGDRVRHDEPFLCSSGLADGPNDGLAAQLQAVVQQCGGPGQRLGVPFGTNAPAFAKMGIPTVVFGPGSIDQAHTHDEWVAIDQLQSAAEIYYQFARHFTGLN